MTVIGLVLLLIVTGTGLLLVVNPFGGDDEKRLAIIMDVPYVGQGVGAGTPLMMHGIAIGRVTSIASIPGGKVRLNADLEPEPSAGLTDALGVDFRPANYFGVTGINLTPGSGGQPLRDGAEIATVPTGNFTLQALLSRMGEITDGVVTPQLVDVINRATRYTDGLNPLIETMVTVADSVTKVQAVSTEQLMRNATGISAAFPGFLDAATAAGYGFNQGSGFVTFKVDSANALPGQAMVAVAGQPQSDEFWQTRSKATLDVIANSLFGAIGKLLSSHTSDLLPAVNLVQTLTDTVPGLVTPAGLSDTMVELRTRFEKLYGGSPEQRALQVHIVLDQLPGVQAPVNAMGAP